jgi:hypothetical protein
MHEITESYNNTINTAPTHELQHVDNLMYAMQNRAEEIREYIEGLSK